MRQAAHHPARHQRAVPAAPLLLVADHAGRAPWCTVRDHRTRLAAAADLFAVVALLALGTVALALAGLDTGTAFGGMGASREITILALVEPTLLVAVFALSVRVGSTNLAAIVTATVCTTRAGRSPRPACSPRWRSGWRWSPRPAGSRWTTRPPTWS